MDMTQLIKDFTVVEEERKEGGRNREKEKRGRGRDTEREINEGRKKERGK